MVIVNDKIEIYIPHAAREMDSISYFDVTMVIGACGWFGCLLYAAPIGTGIFAGIAMWILVERTRA